MDFTNHVESSVETAHVPVDSENIVMEASQLRRVFEAINYG